MRLRRCITLLLLTMVAVAVAVAAAAASAGASPTGRFASTPALAAGTPALAGGTPALAAGTPALAGGTPIRAAGTPIRAQLETPPARLLVYAQEWSLLPSRSRLKPGRVIVQLWNRGQDAHDVRIRRLNRHCVMVGSTQRVPVTQSGQIRQASWHLSKGTYELYCSMPGHMKLGMHARLTVG
jgi:plastocyanin